MRFAISKHLVLFGCIICQLSGYNQSFKNLDLRDTCANSKTGFCHWDLSWGGKNAVKPFITTKGNSLAIHGTSVASVGFAEQGILYGEHKGLAIISLSASIRSDSIEGKGAGLNIGLYDSEGKLIATRDMGGFYSIDWIRGTQTGKKYSISLVIPAQTSRVKIGAILYGKGNAYFSDFAVSIIPVNNRKPSKLAREYVNAALDSIRLHSLVRDSIDYGSLKEKVMEIAGPARTYEECYLAIEYLLESLRTYGDEHSFLMKAAEVKNWLNAGSAISGITYPTFKVVEDYGYVSIPAFHGGNQNQILSFADSLQQILRVLFDKGIKGWIIDLRENTGGNMAPMVAGLGPIFDQEKLGSLVDVNGKPNAWYYSMGRYYWSDGESITVRHPILLKRKLPIAVLTGHQTGSSGEAVLVSFIGNSNTKIIGQPTWGLTTGNGNFKLKDGAEIYLASTVMADRRGKIYKGSISPDILVNAENKDDKDPVIKAAIEWLHQSTKD